MDNLEPFSSNQEMYDRINYLEKRVEELEEMNTSLEEDNAYLSEELDSYLYPEKDQDIILTKGAYDGTLVLHNKKGWMT